jgi:hypothetical protein
MEHKLHGASPHSLGFERLARRVLRTVGVAALLLTCGSAVAGAAPGDPPPGPTYPEIAGGEHLVWIEPAGFAAWVTERSPLPATAPVVVGLGYGHRVGVVRLAWRAHLVTTGDLEELAFVYADLVSIERVYNADGAVRPWWRVGLSFALDLVGPTRGIGTTGYFNQDNGAAGGVGLAHGWGLDFMLGGGWLVRTEAAARLHGAAGRTGIFGAGHLGVGRVF